MTPGARLLCFSIFLLLHTFATCLTASSTAEPPKTQITILYDAFGPASKMQKDWGYAALVEFGGKRILFDSGNNPETLAHNARVKGVDLSRLDFVVMSHRHGDHMGGLSFVLKMNPRVRIYAPKEGFGVYGGDLPGSFYRRDSTLATDQRYFDGAAPEVMRFGSAWPGANFELIDKTTEIAPNTHLIALVSDKPGTLELRELSLALNTPDGMVIVVGCSHPGIDKIIEAARAFDQRIHLVTGGFHLVTAADQDVERTVSALHDNFKVDYVAPGHCTGEPAFAALRKTFGARYIYAGLGGEILIGTEVRSQSLQAESLANESLQAGPVKKIEGEFFIGEHGKGGALSSGRQF